MTIQTDILNTAPPALIELFQVDLSSLGYSYLTEDFTITPLLRTDFNGPNGATSLNDYYGKPVVFTGSSHISNEKLFDARNTLKVTNAGGCASIATTLGELLPSHTIEFWVYIDERVTWAWGNRIFSLKGNNDIYGHYDINWNENLGGIYLYVSNPVCSLNCSPFQKWVHIAIICDRPNNTLKLSVDGVLSPPTNSFELPVFDLNFKLGSSGMIWSMDSRKYFANLRVYNYVKYSANFTPKIPTGILYFTNNKTPINFGGNTYLPWPLLLEGLSYSSTGSPSRPTLTLGNLDLNRKLRDLVYQYSDLVGVPIKYIRTFETYLNTNYEIAAPIVDFVVGRKLSIQISKFNWNSEIELIGRKCIFHQNLC